MTVIHGLLLAASFSALAADGGSAQSQTLCGQPFDGDLAAFAERIRQLPHARAMAGKTRFGLEAILVRPPRALRRGGPGSTHWQFTPPYHPAHPAALCMRMSNERSTGFSLDTQFHCQAAKEQCDQLKSELSAGEQMLRQYLDAMNKSRR